MVYVRVTKGVVGRPLHPFPICCRVALLLCERHIGSSSQRVPGSGHAPTLLLAERYVRIVKGCGSRGRGRPLQVNAIETEDRAEYIFVVRIECLFGLSPPKAQMLEDHQRPEMPYLLCHLPLPLHLPALRLVLERERCDIDGTGERWRRRRRWRRRWRRPDLPWRWPWCRGWPLGLPRWLHRTTSGLHPWQAWLRASEGTIFGRSRLGGRLVRCRRGRRSARWCPRRRRWQGGRGDMRLDGQLLWKGLQLNHLHTRDPIRDDVGSTVEP